MLDPRIVAVYRLFQCQGTPRGLEGANSGLEERNIKS
jgi:hypothetical protein